MKQLINISQRESNAITAQQPVRDSVLENHEKALHEYQQQSMRGYSFSFLSRFRHSACEYGVTVFF